MSALREQCALTKGKREEGVLFAAVVVVVVGDSVVRIEEREREGNGKKGQEDDREVDWVS